MLSARIPNMPSLGHVLPPSKITCILSSRVLVFLFFFIVTTQLCILKALVLTLSELCTYRIF